jgi:FKBP-type peptidyl-prolyl cis-trans isomerase
MVYHVLGKVIWLLSRIRSGFMMLPNQKVEAKCKHNILICPALHRVLTSPDRLDPSNRSAFIIGARAVIKGMELAVTEMTLGEKSIFTIPS